MNKCCIIICFIVLSTIYSIVDAQYKHLGESCSNSCECCTEYCRDSTCINWGDSVDNDQGDDPCDSFDCDEGFRCVRDQVTCIRAPCRPVPRCVNEEC